MPQLTGNSGPFGPPTSFSSLVVAGLPVPYAGSGQIPMTGGNYWFVSSVTGSSGNDGKSVQSPLASVFGANGAYSLAVATNQDVIVCLPGHAETISSATAAQMNKSGVQVVGLGQSGLKAAFTLDTANTSTIAVSAVGNGFWNCSFVANFLSIAAAFTLTLAKNFVLAGCHFNDSSGVLNFLNIVKSTGAANTIDNLIVDSCLWKSLGTTSVNTLILSANDIDRSQVTNNTVLMATTTNAASLMIITAGILTNLNCGYNRCVRKNTTSTAALISVGGTTSTGIVYNNYTQTLDTATNVLFATTVGLAAFNNYLTGVTGASGFLIPVADS